MLRNLILSLLIFAFVGSLTAEISVRSFHKLENDLDARLNEAVKDQNGDLCAIIKVVTSQTGFSFDCGQIGIMKTIQKTGEIWVYVPFSTKRITIAHPQLGFLRDYMFPIPVEKATVYELVLTTDKVVTSIEKSEMDTQWLLVSTEPTGADVYINDQPVGKTPYQNEFPVGKYTYRLQKELYLNEAGIVELRPGDQKQIIKLKLKSSCGSIQISTIPENGAKVSLDGIPLGKTTPCLLEMIPSGEHSIKVSYDMYETTTQKVNIEPGENTPLNIKMNSAFSEVKLQTDPQADIYINGLFKANGSWQGRLSPAVYLFEAKLDKYSTASETKTVEIGVPVDLTLNPKPRTGNLKVISNPFEATIKLNDKIVGQTPATLRNLLVGNYSLELSLPGYSTITENVTINEGQTSITNSNLTDGTKSTDKTATLNNPTTNYNSGTNNNLSSNNNLISNNDLSTKNNLSSNNNLTTNNDLSTKNNLSSNNNLSTNNNSSANYSSSSTSEEFLVVLSCDEPENAYITLNDKYVQRGKLEQKLKPGKYNYRIEAPGYNTINSVFEVIDRNQLVNVNLKLNKIIITDEIYTLAEKMPIFPGDDYELLKFISRNLKYPTIAKENGIQGSVIIRFVITKTGSIDKVEVARSLDSACDNEAIRVVKLLPKWTPGQQNGVPVSVWYTIPIKFKLE